MGTKENPGKFNYYDKALPDEPMFVLLARDPYMAYLLEEWAMLRRRDIQDGKRPQSDIAQAEEAEHCANEAKHWRRNNDGKWRK